MRGNPWPGGCLELYLQLTSGDHVNHMGVRTHPGNFAKNGHELFNFRDILVYLKTQTKYFFSGGSDPRSK